MTEDLEKKEDKEEEKEQNDKDKNEKFAFEKGGLYSKIPKNEKSLKFANLAVIISGLIFIGIIILGVALKC